MTAVLRTAEGSSGTCRYPFFRSRVLNTVQPSKWLEKSARLGTGYLSALVTRLRHLKSPQGRQLPSYFLTRCRGLLHWLDERRMMPLRSHAANISLAALSLSLSRQRNLEVNGGPSVFEENAELPPPAAA